jgi:hypothetical protein
VTNKSVFFLIGNKRVDDHHSVSFTPFNHFALIATNNKEEELTCFGMFHLPSKPNENGQTEHYYESLPPSDATPNTTYFRIVSSAPEIVRNRKRPIIQGSVASTLRMNYTLPCLCDDN